MTGFLFTLGAFRKKRRKCQARKFRAIKENQSWLVLSPRGRRAGWGGGGCPVGKVCPPGPRGRSGHKSFLSLWREVCHPLGFSLLLSSSFLFFNSLTRVLYFIILLLQFTGFMGENHGQVALLPCFYELRVGSGLVLLTTVRPPWECFAGVSPISQVRACGCPFHRRGKGGSKGLVIWPELGCGTGCCPPHCSRKERPRGTS